jgi:subtilisin-like proprotein convertase family protein
MNIVKLTLLSCLIITATFASGQNTVYNCWKQVSAESIDAVEKTKRNTLPSHAFYYQLNLQDLKTVLLQAPLRQPGVASTLEILFPDATGNFERFRVMESPIMHPALATKYPMIKTYCAQGIDDPTATMRFSITQFGLHCFTLSGIRSTNYIDAYTTDLNYYIVYDKESLAGNIRNFECLTDEDANLPSMRNHTASAINETNDQKLRTYRLAQSCTAEYGNIFAVTPGSEKADILAQMTITINRVNGVYERDLAVTMQFVANNDTLIFYGNTAADPWTNEWNTTTAQTIDARIGVNNYDIGHNFNTTGGGNAGCISCVCLSTSQNNTHKGRGYTGSANPVGDPFDIDYVAHEMGHQYGGYHTMNTCSRSGSGTTEVEPASASSIMGYAGICPTNVQANSDDDFTWVNVRDISANIQTGNSTCAPFTILINNPPTADAGNDYTIPKGTAYILEGAATDLDGIASLTYNWCQNDPAQSPGNGAPQPTYAVGPLYRAIRPSTSPNRYMPNLRSVVLNNLTPTWEVTPNVSRTMNFSFIVRDNDINGGQTASDLMVVNVANVGPFVVTSQSTSVTWNEGTSETITWNVAGTDAGVVNTPFVNIYLSLDSGFTYPFTLASNIPNNGSTSITVPAGATTQWGRIMVRGAGNIFYALNNAFITIQASEFVMNVSNTSQSLCPPTDANYNFTYNTFLSFADTTTFSATGNPPGSTVIFNPTSAVADGTPVQVTVAGLTSAMIGTFTLTITGTSPSVVKSTNVTLNVLDPNPANTFLISPANGSSGVALNTILSWNAVNSPGIFYSIEIATDSLFTNIISSATGLTSTSYVVTGLAATSVYFWHVLTYNACNSNIYTGAWTFTTNSCGISASINVPVLISATGTPTVTSTLNIPVSGTITDVNVIGLVGQHTWIHDLTITIKSPSNTTVTLFSNICNNEDNFNVNFDDAATTNTLPCPPVGGGTYQPQTPLSAFNGQNANGIWTLTIADNANLDGGSLDGWGLEICTNSAVGIATYIASTTLVIYPNPSTGIVNISTAGQANEKKKISITNQLGQQIIEQLVDANTTTAFDLHALNAGIYFVQLIGNDKTEIRKFVLTK